MKTFNTNIGGLRIKWLSDNHKIVIHLKEHYKDYIVSTENSGISLKVLFKKPQIPDEAIFSFKTRSWWYGRSKDKMYILFPGEKSNSLAEISNRFDNIVFYTQNTNAQLLKFLFPELLYSMILPKFQGILLHACGIKVGERAFVFMAPPEGGKSTMAKLALRKNFTILNDDRIILRKIKNKYIVYGNPWHGELTTTFNEFDEVKEVFFLKKSNKNYVRKINKRAMFLEFFKNSFYFREDKKHFQKVMEVILDIIYNVKGYKLGFKPDGNIWRYLDERFK